MLDKWTSPTRAQRRFLKQQCNSNCFLFPEAMKFPICDKNCTIQCAGVHAAYVRAREWKYEEIAKTAELIFQKHCT